MKKQQLTFNQIQSEIGWLHYQMLYEVTADLHHEERKDIKAFRYQHYYRFRKLMFENYPIMKNFLSLMPWEKTKGTATQTPEYKSRKELFINQINIQKRKIKIERLKYKMTNNER